LTGTCGGGVGTPADESVVAGALLPVDVVWQEVVGVEVRPAAQRDDVGVDVDADATVGPLAVVETLADRPRTGVLGRTERRVADVPLPLGTVAPHLLHVHAQSVIGMCRISQSGRERGESNHNTRLAFRRTVRPRPRNADDIYSHQLITTTTH